MHTFLTPSSTQRFQLEVKRSRFITTVAHVDGKHDAKSFTHQIRHEFQDASHHCWAMIAGSPDDIYQYDQSDDGEPKGTAGRPMLKVLQHAGLGNTIIVVTRYFGGIKLGTGGLVRAYTRSVSEALLHLRTRVCCIRDVVIISIPYSLLASLDHWLRNTNIDIIDKVFTDEVRITLKVPPSEINLLTEQLAGMGGGSIFMKGPE